MELTVHPGPEEGLVELTSGELVAGAHPDMHDGEVQPATPIVGHTAGTFDMFHIGHLNLLRRSRSSCDRLIVGVSTDELVMRHKGKRPVVPFEERIEIVRAVRFVDDVVEQVTMDKLVAWESLRFDRIFVGDDYRGSAMWERFEHEFPKLGVEIRYFRYTAHTSSTLLRERLLALPATG